LISWKFKGLTIATLWSFHFRIWVLSHHVRLNVRRFFMAIRGAVFARKKPISPQVSAVLILQEEVSMGRTCMWPGAQSIPLDAAVTDLLRGFSSRRVSIPESQTMALRLVGIQ
jgi:hypothetical protein